MEREIAGTALPFALGAASFLYAAGLMAAHPYGTAAASTCVTVIMLAVLLYLRRHQAGNTITWIAVTATTLACGLMTAATCNVTAVSTSSEPGWISSYAIAFGEKMKTAIDAIPFHEERTGQIVKALLTGDRNGMSEETVRAFRRSGASHILALSGLHLGIIYGILGFLTRGFGNRSGSQLIRSAAIVSICGFYTLATGAGASITRAFIFIVTGECARMSRRRSVLKNTLLTALLVHLAIFPASIGEIGFQMSYAAIAGIAFLFPWMQGFWPGDRREDAPLTKAARWLWDSAAMSISCQITTAPLAYIYFRTFPTQFILTNLIALPLTGIVIPLSLATLAAGMSGWHPHVLVRATEWLVSLLYESLYLLSTM